MLLDTSGLFTLHHRPEPYHAEAVAFFQAANQRLMHSYVVAEFVALSHARRLPRERAMQFIRDMTEAPSVDMVWIDQSLHDQALDLLFNRLDKTYSLCDAVSFILMREHGVQDA